MKLPQRICAHGSLFTSRRSRERVTTMAELKQYEDLAALAARLFMAAIFVLYGYFKLTGYAGTVAYLGR